MVVSMAKERLIDAFLSNKTKQEGLMMRRHGYG
jgi:hypothetical protein